MYEQCVTSAGCKNKMYMKPFHSVGYISEVQIKKDLSLFDPFITTRILFFLRVHASVLETSHKVVCPSCYLFKNDFLGTEEPKVDQTQM